MDNLQFFVRFPDQSSSRPSAEEELPEGFVPLQLVLQPSGMSVELRQANVLLGRHSEANVRIPLPDVSRRHCRFVFSNGGWHVQDLKSLNGTYLNDQPVEDWASLTRGDFIRVGGFTFTVNVLSQDVAPPSTATSARIPHNLPEVHGENNRPRQAS